MKEIILLILICLFLVGCAAYANLRTDFSNHSINWQEEAGFYSSCYPGCSDNEKAFMLIKEMKKEKAEFSIKRRFYTVEVITIYQDRNRIWPVKRTEKVHWNSLLSKKSGEK